ncbi:hypothetical protein PL335_06430 [Sulfitobacter faviae]|uniref:hypothetical protein n=1 Tax=Sulfitobacter faviae TaxID=1775881 RepID=UPI0023082B15|nr:hypothetical protein [Sulfitobacter faviae]WCE67980.1 hypothetical protein PL335_06430 [Sulfitobacter faviae]
MNMIHNHPKIKTPRGNTVSRRSALGITGGSLAAFMVGATAVEAATHDPIPGWFAEWKKWRKVEVELSALPEGGDFDMPEQIAASNRCEKLSEQIAHAKPTTAAGVAAQLEWLDIDSFGLGGIGDLNIFALRNAIAAVRGGVA